MLSIVTDFVVQVFVAFPFSPNLNSTQPPTLTIRCLCFLLGGIHSFLLFFILLIFIIIILILKEKDKLRLTGK